MPTTPLELATSYDHSVHRWPQLVHADQLVKPVVDHLLARADVMLNWLRERDRCKMSGTSIPPPPTDLRSHLVKILFTEPSTRTETSCWAAAGRLGASTHATEDTENPESSHSSRKKGESWGDTFRMFAEYHLDAVVLRSADPTLIYQLAHALEVYDKDNWDGYDKRWGVAINAGNGGDQHPTQALTDLFTLRRAIGKLDGMTLLIAGDASRARAVNSLLIGLSNCARDLTIKFAVPVLDELELKPDALILSRLRQAGVTCEEVPVPDRGSFIELARTAQVGYWTRLQVERYGDMIPAGFAHRNAAIVRLDQELLELAPELYALHPLPAREEIEQGIGRHPHTLFDAQAGNGVPVRMALLAECLTNVNRLKKLAYG